MPTMPNAPEPDLTTSDRDSSHQGTATDTQGSEPDIEVDVTVGAPAPKTEASQEEPAAERDGSIGPSETRVTPQQVKLQKVAPKICEFQATTVARHA